MTDPRPLVSAILVDVDSTLYPMGPLLRKHLARLFGIFMEEEEVTTWSFWLKAGVSSRDGRAIIEAAHADEEILAAVPFVGAVEAVNRWQAAGALIHIVSDRRPVTHAATVAWLSKIGLAPDTITLGAGINKVAYVADQGIGLAIDDKPTFLAKMGEQGRPAATIRYPYNLPVLADHPAIIGADNWADLAAEIDRRFRFGPAEDAGDKAA